MITNFSLLAKRNKELLKEMRNELGSAESIFQALRNLNETDTGNKCFHLSSFACPQCAYFILTFCTTATVNLLERSMILEYKYGPPEGHLHVTDCVLHYLQEVLMPTALL